MERIPHNSNEVLRLRGRQQVEIALGALAFANVEADVTRILRSVIEAHDLPKKERADSMPSSFSIEMGGTLGSSMRAHVLMSLEVVLMSDEASNEHKLVARELYDILTIEDRAA